MFTPTGSRGETQALIRTTTGNTGEGRVLCVLMGIWDVYADRSSM
jgi:hypothetical protein